MKHGKILFIRVCLVSGLYHWWHPHMLRFMDLWWLLHCSDIKIMAQMFLFFGLYHKTPLARLVHQRLMKPGCVSHNGSLIVLWQSIQSPSGPPIASDCCSQRHWRRLWWPYVGPALYFPSTSESSWQNWPQSLCSPPPWGAPLRPSPDSLLRLPDLHSVAFSFWRLLWWILSMGL